MARQDTTLEAEGAEFLVLGQLLLQRIATYKKYTNMPGYDLVATNPATNMSARIQVKSRWRTGAPFFLIKNFDCEFVVAVCLNRGKKGGGGDVRAPDYFVLPLEGLFRFWVQTTFAADGTTACAYYIGAACTQKRKSR